MNAEEKSEILVAAKEFFRNRIAKNHIKNTEKLADPKCFHTNPFLDRYLAKFAFGDTGNESIAKAMIYPRVLGTSISTSFGTNMQYFCKDVLSSYASTTSGIDIEFLDAVDGRRKYCQIKAGPDTINKDDVETIKGHFRGVRNLARTNGLLLQMNDCIVGVFYGTREDLSSNYKAIDEDYPVYAGEEFWFHLTGDHGFYAELIGAFAEVAEEMDGTQLLAETIQKLADALEN